jgi:hypothetical protein
MMSRAKVLLTITDGEDNHQDRKKDFPRAINLLNAKGIYSLSVGIGTVDVDHEGLNILADKTGGIHIAPLNSMGVAQALSNITQVIHTQIAKAELLTNASYQERIEIQQQNLRAAIDLFILIDCSKSMKGLRNDDTWTGDKEKLINTQHSAINVLRTLHPDFDRVAVAKFWGRYQLLTRFTSDFQHCADLIASIDVDESTGLYRAICFASEEF